MRGWSLLLVLSAWPFLHPAHDGGDALSAWYRSLKIPGTGGSCCSEQDCHPVEARLNGDHWEVLDPTRILTSNPAPPFWERVPDEAVLRQENREGRPVACRFAGRILCFVPPAGV